MDVLNEFPEVMRNAREDLAGHIGGQFSPDDWQKIRLESLSRLKSKMSLGINEGEAWNQVIREFNSEKHWGFHADYRKPAKGKVENPNLGVSFIWMTFTAFIVTKMAVVWTGQIYTHSDDPKDKWIFFGALTLAILNWAIFLWRTRKHRD